MHIFTNYSVQFFWLGSEGTLEISKVNGNIGNFGNFGCCREEVRKLVNEVY
jgi:hypothetical protein